MNDKIIAEFREWWSSRPNKNDVEANGIWALWMERMLRRHEAEQCEISVDIPTADLIAELEKRRPI